MLDVLETEHRMALPAPHWLDMPVPAPVGVQGEVRDVEGLRLVVVEDEAQRRIWNTLLSDEHPWGTTTFVGCRLRHLVGSIHQWLGAVGFSASALLNADADSGAGFSVRMEP